MVFFVYVIRTANGGNLGVLDAGAIIAPGEDNNRELNPSLEIA